MPVIFALRTSADPGLLPRILQAFAKQAIVPERWLSERSPDGTELRIAVTTNELSQHAARRLAQGFRQVPGVFSAEISA